MKTYNLTFAIGAQLLSNFSPSFNTAYTEMTRLAKETAALSGTLKDVSGFTKTKAALEENREKLRVQQEQYKSLKDAVAAAGRDVENQFSPKIKKQEELIKETTEAISANQDILKNYSDGSLGYKEINAEIEQHKKKLKEQQEEYDRLKAAQSDAAKEAEGRFSDSLKNQEKQIQKTSDAIDKQQEKLYKYSANLAEAGINVNKLSEEEERLQKQYRDFSSAKKELQEVSKWHDDITEKAKENRDELLKVSAVYAGMAGAVYKGAIEPAINFESAYTGVLKTVDGTPEQLRKIREDILDLSTVTPTAASDIAAVAESAGQLGINVDNITDFSKVMIDLGESTDLSSTEAASSLAKFANITKMSADKYSNLGSVIVDLGNNFATTESDIVSMATRLASSGEITGLSESQIMAVAAALSSVGIEAEAGGSSVSKLLKSFDTMYWNESPALAQYADVAGVSTEKFREIYGKDSLSAISMFINGLNDVDRNGKNAVQILDELDIKEVRMSNAVLSLAASDDILSKAVETANTAWEENTALAVEAGKRYSTTESKIQMAKNSITNAGIAVGETLTPAIAEGAQKVNEIARSFAQWAQENPETLRELTRLAAEFAVLHISIKGAKFLFSDFAKIGSGAVKGLVKMRNGIMSISGASKTASTVMTASFSAAAAAAAVFAVAYKVSYDNYKQGVQAAADLALYNNGASTSLKDLAEAFKESSSESYKAAQNINANAEEYKEISENIAEARKELEFYGQSVNNDGILDSSEAQALQQPFADLVGYLKSGFAEGYQTVFQNFKESLTNVADSAGVDVAKLHGLLSSFEEGYNEKVADIEANVSAYIQKKTNGEGTTAEEDAEFEKNIRISYELAQNESQTLEDFDKEIQKIGSIDFGENQQAAIDAMNELEDYFTAYMDEINSAQEEINRQYDIMRAKTETLYKAGQYDDEEYKSAIEALNAAQTVSDQSYQQTWKDFYDNYGEIINKIQGQVSSAWVDSYNQAYEHSNEFGPAVKNAWDAWFNWGWGKDGTTLYESNVNTVKHNAMITADEANKTIQDKFDELKAKLESSPIEIPVNVKINAKESGLVNVPDSDLVQAASSAVSIIKSDINGAVYSNGTGVLHLEPEKIYNYSKNVVGAAYAGGTDYSADTFLAGEKGAEIITNARGYKVYTADETKDIFDSYMQCVSFMPQMQRTAAKAPAAPMAENYGGGSYSINLTIEQNITANNSPELEGKLTESNRQLAAQIKSVLEDIEKDRRRTAF